MLQKVLQLNETIVEDIMVPLVEIRSLPSNANVAELERLTLDTGYSRFPVYEKRIDKIIGVISLRKILTSEETENLSSERIKRLEILPFLDNDILFVPETKRVGELLYELSSSNIFMAGVVDEYGGMIGMVTVADLAEQIVGAFLDEREVEQSLLQRISSNEFECDGRLSLLDLSNELGFRIDRSYYETAAGLVLHLAGKVPEEGEIINYRGYKIKVLQVKQHRIMRLNFKNIGNRG